MKGRSCCLIALLAAGCAGASAPESSARYMPDRRDYATFRAGYPDVLDPNYLPFMVHRVPQSGGREDLLILCRWNDEDMPLPVYVHEPEIPDSLQDEFPPRRDARIYVDGVDAALSTWEEHLEGLVRFRRVTDPAQARLHVTLVGAKAPVPEDDVKVLGTTRLAGACVPGGWDPDAERLEVEYQVSGLRIYVADEFGLLAASQVEWIALHEIGHALGMRAHSPIPGDLMYEIVRDRMDVAEGLSIEDVNSFVSLYRLPNGTVYGRAREGGAPAEAPPPTGPVRLALAPYVDARLGFHLRLPEGWLSIDSGKGMVAVNGVTWDYSASLQVVVNPYPTIDAYLERYRDYYLRRGRLLHFEELVVNGRRAMQGVMAHTYGETVEQVTLIESGDGRVVVVTADCAIEDLHAYSPWFDATLASLEIWNQP